MPELKDTSMRLDEVLPLVFLSWCWSKEP
jgi:hypothetical protein